VSQLGRGRRPQLLEIVEKLTEQSKLRLQRVSVERSWRHELSSSRSSRRNQSVSMRSVMAAICALAKAPGSLS